jgi:uncharacterized protein
VTTLLADGNLLVALTVIDHVHHRAASSWFEEAEPRLATCPITEGILLRFLIREGHRAPDAMAVLDGFRSQDWHEFWTDSIPYEGSHMTGVVGHRQVTDAYLVALARHHNGALATLDRGLATLHGTDVHLLTP